MQRPSRRRRRFATTFQDRGEREKVRELQDKLFFTLLLGKALGPKRVRGKTGRVGVPTDHAFREDHVATGNRTSTMSVLHDYRYIQEPCRRECSKKVRMGPVSFVAIREFGGKLHIMKAFVLGLLVGLAFVLARGCTG